MASSTARAFAAGALALAANIGHAQTSPGKLSGQESQGKAKSRPCAACHGPLGIATLPMAPNLAGQPEAYLAEQLKAYRSGKRVNEMMTLMAKPLSDDDIAALAAWYSSLIVEAREKP